MVVHLTFPITKIYGTEILLEISAAAICSSLSVSIATVNV